MSLPHYITKNKSATYISIQPSEIHGKNLASELMYLENSGYLYVFAHNKAKVSVIFRKKDMTDTFYPAALCTLRALSMLNTIFCAKTP